MGLCLNCIMTFCLTQKEKTQIDYDRFYYEYCRAKSYFFIIECHLIT